MKNISKLSIILFSFLVIITLMIPYSASATDQKDPCQADAQIYANFHGVTIDEAFRRFDLEKDAGVLDAELSSKEPGTFAGLWIEHKPQFKIVVLFTENGEETIKPYLSLDLTSITEVRSAEKSFVALQNAQAHILSFIRSLGIPVDSGIDVRANQVIVDATGIDRTKIEDALRASSFCLPSHVAFKTVNELAQPVTDIYGGLQLNGPNYEVCTRGFAVVTAGGTRGITTAAHANNSQSYNGSNLTFQSENLGYYYDIQWHTTPGFNVTNKIQWWSDGSTRDITGTKYWSETAIGTYVSKYGRTTNYTGGYVSDKSITLEYIPNCQPYFIKVDTTGGYNPVAQGGDSGGPFFWLNDAYGTTCAADSDGNAYYMASNYISSGLGVYILTYP